MDVHQHVLLDTEYVLFSFVTSIYMIVKILHGYCHEW